MPYNIQRKRQKDPLQAEQMIYGNNLCVILEINAMALRQLLIQTKQGLLSASAKFITFLALHHTASLLFYCATSVCQQTGNDCIQYYTILCLQSESKLHKKFASSRM